jgi:hypothetical protein
MVVLDSRSNSEMRLRSDRGRKMWCSGRGYGTFVGICTFSCLLMVVILEDACFSWGVESLWGAVRGYDSGLFGGDKESWCSNVWESWMARLLCQKNIWRIVIPLLNINSLQIFRYIRSRCWCFTMNFLFAVMFMVI